MVSANWRENCISLQPSHFFTFFSIFNPFKSLSLRKWYFGDFIFLRVHLVILSSCYVNNHSTEHSFTIVNQFDTFFLLCCHFTSCAYILSSVWCFVILGLNNPLWLFVFEMTVLPTYHKNRYDLNNILREKERI